MRRAKDHHRKPRLVVKTGREARRVREDKQRREFWRRIHSELRPLRVRSA